MAGTGQQEARYDFLDVIIVGCIFMFFLFPFGIYVIVSNWDTIIGLWPLTLLAIPGILYWLHICRRDAKVVSEYKRAEIELNGPFSQNGGNGPRPYSRNSK